ncbi:unnamed protein product [Nippostrongylus brasiliensis]|uniref:Pilus assembly protein n=1 Tax=Nippostrongylus brasiliensis TaxID=27835 RepID=A0A0N4YKK3_NIPBR|nr:unnamed protein product [Nippostrongylus brasiliensis]
MGRKKRQAKDLGGKNRQAQGTTGANPDTIRNAMGDAKPTVRTPPPNTERLESNDGPPSSAIRRSISSGREGHHRQNDFRSI